MVIPARKLFLLLHHHCKVVTGKNHNGNSLGDRRLLKGSSHRLRTTVLESERCGAFLAPATFVPWAWMSWTHFPNTGWEFLWEENRVRPSGLSPASHSVKWEHHTAHVLILGTLVIIPLSNTSHKFLHMWQTNVDVCNWNYRLALNSDIILPLSCECLHHAHLSKNTHF